MAHSRTPRPKKVRPEPPPRDRLRSPPPPEGMILSASAASARRVAALWGSPAALGRLRCPPPFRPLATAAAPVGPRPPAPSLEQPPQPQTQPQPRTSPSPARGLSDVSARAREISSRRRRRRPVPRATGGKASAATATASAAAAPGPADLGEATEAADALLALTSSPVVRGAFGPPAAAAAARPPPDAAEALHLAFLSVASWLQAAADADPAGSDQAAVDYAIARLLGLAARSADLGLPLALPQFRSLASLAARRSSPSRSPAGQVAEAAGLLLRQLESGGPDLPGAADLFHEALVGLVRRGLIREAMEVLDVMEGDGFGITEVDVGTSLEMLSSVAEGMGLAAPGGGDVAAATAAAAAATDPPAFDPIDATELVFRLRGPLMGQLDDLSARMEDDVLDATILGSDASGSLAAHGELAELLEMLNQEEGEEGGMAGDEEEGDGDGDGDGQLAAGGGDLIADIQRLSDAVDAIAAGEEGAVVLVAAEVPGGAAAAAAAPAAKPASYASLDGLHGRLADEMVYVRRGPGWDLPDLVDQLQRITGNEHIVYTRKYEEHIIQELANEDSSEEE